MKKHAVRDGACFSELLLVAFVVLKLCGVIDWSWWWVLSPIWISSGLAILIGFVAAVWVTLKKSKRF